MWEAAQDVPYAYKGSEWLGYDNTKSFKIKVDCVLWAVVACEFVPMGSPGACLHFTAFLLLTAG